MFTIDSDQFETCFIEWVGVLAQLNPKEVIAIDGKTIRGTESSGKKSPVHMVSAWATDNNIELVLILQLYSVSLWLCLINL